LAVVGIRGRGTEALRLPVVIEPVSSLEVLEIIRVRAVLKLRRKASQRLGVGRGAFSGRW